MYPDAYRKHTRALICTEPSPRAYAVQRATVMPAPAVCCAHMLQSHAPPHMVVHMSTHALLTSIHAQISPHARPRGVATYYTSSTTARCAQCCAHMLHSQMHAAACTRHGIICPQKHTCAVPTYCIRLLVPSSRLCHRRAHGACTDPTHGSRPHMYHACPPCTCFICPLTYVYQHQPLLHTHIYTLPRRRCHNECSYTLPMQRDPC